MAHPMANRRPPRGSARGSGRGFGPHPIPKPKQLVWFDVKIKARPETLPDLALVDVEDDASGHGPGRLSLLGMPLEVRLQIYRWVHLMHPVKYAEVANWCPNPSYQDRPVHRRLIVKVHKKDCPQYVANKGGKAKSTIPSPPLLNPHRPMACIPTALLQSCRQVYRESRKTPFLTNEFAFVNWLSPGSRAASTFLVAGQPWQRDTIRHVRLETKLHDIWDGDLKPWAELCGYWARGLRTMRLKIVSNMTLFPEEGGDDLRSFLTVPFPLLQEGLRGWIEDGLMKLQELRQLEVELEGFCWKVEFSLRWGQRLEELLNTREEGNEKRERIRVICVETKWN